MKDKSYSATFSVDQSPEEVFAAINNVSGWWSGEIRGETRGLGAEFTYLVPGAHTSTQKITAFVPGVRVEWRVQDAELSFVENKAEWNGTTIVFEIGPLGNHTGVTFTHDGLVPEYECYDGCASAWDALVLGNLQRLIRTGKPQPSPW